MDGCMSPVLRSFPRPPEPYSYMPLQTENMCNTFHATYFLLTYFNTGGQVIKAVGKKKQDKCLCTYLATSY